jgi:hypothetical protein
LNFFVKNGGAQKRLADYKDISNTEHKKMNNGKQRALPRWDTPPKKDDWNEKKERPDAGMILKRNEHKKGGSQYKPRLCGKLHNHLP